MKQLTVARALADVLGAWGAKFVFGTVGDTILPFLACLGDHPLRFIPLRNEESAAYAASAYAKLTGTVGIVVADGGPGTGRLVNGLADALSDGAPVLALTGQVESMYLGTGHVQYINQQQLLGAVTVRSENLGNPAGLTTVVSGLLRTAIVQGGPVHLSIPKDFWQQLIQAAPPQPEPFLGEGAQSPESVIAKGAEFIRGFQRPMILAGRGAGGAVQEVVDLAERLGAGIVYTLPLVGSIPDHPLVVGGLGEGGAEAATELLHQCDGLVKVGATYWPTALTSDRKMVLAIDKHPVKVSQGIPADFGLVGDAGTMLTKLLGKLAAAGKKDAWAEHVTQTAEQWQRRLEGELAEASPGHTGRAMRVLAQFAAADALFCLDVGDHVLWFSRFFKGKGQEVLVSGRWRGMGFSLGASIAAQLVYPQRQVFALVGDGGFSMLMGEFSSAVDQGLPILFVLLNNRAYATEASAMAAAGLKPIGVHLPDVRFDQVAQACGGVGLRVTGDSLLQALQESRLVRQPVLLDLQVEPIRLPTAGG